MDIIESEKTEVEAQVARTSIGHSVHSFELDDRPWNPQPPPCPSPRRKIFLVASLAMAIQFGWAIQLSLLTPYVQLLSLSHKCSSILWICGPISAMILQPIIGYYSDHSTSRFGRRRPFIVAGVAFVIFAEFLIGFAVDFGYLSYNQTAVAPNFGYFMVGFLILDVGNNILQATCRALLGDMAAEDHSKTHLGNAAFSFFMAIGNISGYSIDIYRNLFLVFPFSRTTTCDINCANLKSCMIISIALLISLTSLILSFTDEKTYLPSILEGGSQVTRARPPFLDALKKVLAPRPMRALLVVTCLNWVALFPFLLFDIDWMGKEVYGGAVGGPRYDKGVQAGAFGLMLNSVVIGVMSVAIEPLRRWVGGARRVWGMTNLWLAICMAVVVYVSKMAEYERDGVAGGGVLVVPMPFRVAKACALVLFSLLGISIAATYSIPFALASIFAETSGAGQGLSLGVLNLGIVIPQILVSATSGAWDDLFGGGNLPSFAVAAVMATASAILSFTLLPELS